MKIKTIQVSKGSTPKKIIKNFYFARSSLNSESHFYVITGECYMALTVITFKRLISQKRLLNIIIWVLLTF